MCEPIDWSRLRGHDPSSPPDLLTIEATAVTGFEGAAASEVAEKFCIEEEEVVKAQGRVLFDIPEDRVEEVMDPLHRFVFIICPVNVGIFVQVIKLRTIDNAFVVVWAKRHFDYSGTVVCHFLKKCCAVNSE